MRKHKDPNEHNPKLEVEHHHTRPRPRRSYLKPALLVVLVITLGLWRQYGAYWTYSTNHTNTTSTTQEQHFELKHVLHHNTEHDRKFGRLDIASDSSVATQQVSDLLSALRVTQPLKNKPKTIRRMANRSPDFVEGYLKYARETRPFRTIDLEWVDDTVPVPDVTDRDTVLQIAKMCQDAYVDVPFTGDWLNVSDPWHGKSDIDFGWMDDGLRGHVFTDSSNSTVVISLKGTSAAIFDSGGDTATNDKVNDNLLFSCCCARISYLWNTVCDCYTGDSYTCNQTCLEEQLFSEDRYYRAALDIYRNVSSLYPESNIWMVGHSLGGSLSAMVGRTYGVPAVSFEAPPELLATKRLHLPMPPGVPQWEDYIWHFGHTADPIYMGVCNGAGSSCWIGGYAMETRCHSGLQCTFDTVKEEGWYVSLVNHRILTVIHDLLEKRNTTVECKVPPPCKDCFNWKFVVPEDPDPVSGTTSGASGPTGTSTTSTTSTTTSSSTSSSSTTTRVPQKCLERTWYGRCIRYGPDIPGSTSTTTITLPAETQAPSSCMTSATQSKTSTGAPPGGEPHRCLKRTWYGRCYQWSDEPDDVAYLLH